MSIYRFMITTNMTPTVGYLSMLAYIQHLDIAEDPVYQRVKDFPATGFVCISAWFFVSQVWLYLKKGRTRA